MDVLEVFVYVHCKLYEISVVQRIFEDSYKTTQFSCVNLKKFLGQITLDIESFL